MPTPHSQVRRTTAITNREPERLVETIIATLEGVSTQGASARLKLSGWCQYTPSAETTRVTFRIRRGPETGSTEVARFETESGITRERSSPIDMETIDAPGEVANQTYILTVTSTGATARGVVNGVALEAIIGIN